MHETDANIHQISRSEDRENLLTVLQELLGLRGHMQDELLRIEKMLAADDPNLTVCAHYDMSLSMCA